MGRPVLFLDVDGVLNPFGPVCPPGFAEHDLFPGEEPVRVNPEHGTWITELLAAFDIVWATFWNGDANRLLVPLLHIDPLPVLTMPLGPSPPSAKVPLIASCAGKRPAAWIDDAHTPEARAWSQHTTGPFDMRVFPGDHFYLTQHQDKLLDLLKMRLRPFTSGLRAGAARLLDDAG